MPPRHTHQWSNELQRGFAAYCLSHGCNSVLTNKDEAPRIYTTQAFEEFKRDWINRKRNQW